MNHNFLNICLFLTALLLGGCVSLFPEDAQKTETLALSVNCQNSLQTSPVPWQLTILEPTASASLSTNRVMVKRNAYLVSYVADIYWPSTLPLMVQDLLLNALALCGKIKGLSKSDGSIKADYSLKTEIQKFELQDELQDVAKTQTPTVHVAFLFQLIKVSTQEVVAQKQVQAVKTAEAKNPAAVVAAFNASLTQSFDQMIPWVLKAEHYS